MDLLNRLALPFLAICCIGGFMWLAWLLYREDPVEKALRERPEPKRKPRRTVL